MLVEIRDIGAMLVLVRIDDAVSSKRRRTAIRVSTTTIFWMPKSPRERDR
jgi:hypothetical protein